MPVSPATAQPLEAAPTTEPTQRAASDDGAARISGDAEGALRSDPDPGGHDMAFGAAAVSGTAPALRQPQWSGKKTAVAAALAIGLSSMAAVGAAAAVPQGTGATSGGPGRLPGGPLPGGRFPGSQLPGGQLPGGQVPGGQVPLGRLPGGQLPGTQPQGTSSSSNSGTAADDGTVTT
jgi:hypothetical protein